MKIAMKVIGRKGYISPQSMYDGKILRQAHKILSDPTHTLPTEPADRLP